jgi:hypothetical protein
MRGKHGNHRKGTRHPGFLHGESKKTPEHAAWLEMRKRCLCATGRAYADYGGRGITICDRWLNSYANFLADMGRKPSRKHSLDRIDNNRGYSPDNCRWATQNQQVTNRRDTVFVPFNGKSIPIGDAARLTGIDRVKIWKRIFYLGWSPERALST